MVGPNSAAPASAAQKKRMSLLQMTPSTAHTASTPDLSSDIIPELFDYEKGRPRSWSVRSEDDLRRQSRQYANHTPPNALIWNGSRRGSTLGQTSPSSPSSPSSPPMPISASAFFSEESGAEKLQDHRSRNATNSVRAASIRSSARSSMLFGDGFFDNIVSRSQPQVATTFAGGARTIEARGKVVAQAQAQAQAQTQAQSQQPGSSRMRSRSRPVSFYGVPASMSGRKNVLNMLRPLATRDTPSEAPSSTTDNDGTASTLSTSESASASASASESESVPASAAAISISTAVAAAPTKPNDATSIVAVDSILASDTAPTKNTGASSSDECKDSRHTETDTTSSAEQLTPRTSAARYGLVSDPVVEPVSAVITTHDVVVGFDEPQQHQHQQKQPDSLPDQSVSMWSKLAWLTLRSLSNAGQKQADSEPVAHKAAVDRLRDIESKQPTASKVDSAPASDSSASTDSAISPDAPNSAEDIATSTGSTVIAAADESLGSSVAVEQGVLSREAVDNSPNAADGNLSAETETRMAVAIATKPAKVASTSTGWFRGWLGTHRDANNSNVAESVSALDGRRSIQLSENNTNSEVGPPQANALDTPHSLSVTGTGASTSTLLAPKNGQSSPNADVPDSRSHNPHPQGNMLLPDLDIGDRILAASNVAPTDSEPPAQSRCSTASSSKSSNSSNGDACDTTIYKDGRPLHKRLRTIGKSVFESFVDMAPDWARTIVRGKTGADTLGQSGITSDNGGEQLTSGQIRESMDEGAKSLGRIAVIGVHGWFPIRMVQMIAGEPTGKSEKFCLMMRDALKSYLLESHGVEIDDEEITLFPLVGEGRIEDRVELLLSQITDTDEPADKSHPENAPARSESRAASDIVSLSATATASTKGKRKSIAITTAAKEAVAVDSSSSNPTGKQSVVMADALMPKRSMRAEILKAADTVFVVTHSQGTPVSAMLLERLIELAIVDTGRQRVGMLAMAGISHGPFPYLKDNLVIRYLESEAARELFELMDPSSYQSQRYVASLSTILHKGVRLICTGSWVDEVVPLYSAILQGVSHPNVYRAVYIDAPHYLDDFLTNLIVFALRLRNMDIYDHDLLIHLSE
ncbi:hypothetical protein LPJ66_009038, partial [Kickxella alabastrina]